MRPPLYMRSVVDRNVVMRRIAVLQIRMRKWQWISKRWGSVINPLKGKHWIGIRGQPERKEDRSKPGKGPFQRMQENVATHGVSFKLMVPCIMIQC